MFPILDCTVRTRQHASATTTTHPIFARHDDSFMRPLEVKGVGLPASVWDMDGTACSLGRERYPCDIRCSLEGNFPLGPGPRKQACHDGQSLLREALPRGGNESVTPLSTQDEGATMSQGDYAGQQGTSNGRGRKIGRQADRQSRCHGAARML